MSTLKKVLPILGRWRGEGVGTYPTMNTFHYIEEAEFSQLPNKPIFVYTHKTWHKDTQNPMHHEQGYIRALGDSDHVEFLVAQPTGVTEIEEGVVSEQDHNDGKQTTLQFNTKSIQRTSTAKHPYAIEISRKFTVTQKEDKWVMDIHVDMATENTPKTRHLTASLHRF
jgi:hypothetical protein